MKRTVRCVPLVLLVAVLSVAMTRVAVVGGSSGGVVYRGASTGAEAIDFPLLRAMGATHARVYALWRYVQPTLTALETGLTVAALRADPALIDAWAASAAVDWAAVDQRMARVAAANMTAIVEVSEGTLNGLPTYSGKPADPNVIGAELYWAYQYRAARAVVRRYRPLYPAVRLFQIENELNEAYLAGFGGQRYVALGAAEGGYWANVTFLSATLQVLRAAVKDEDPHLLVTTNLHCDVHRNVHELLRVPLYYEDAAALWAPLLDVVSFDAYPNMFVATPLYTDVLALTTRNITAAIAAAAKAADAAGQPMAALPPVMCMETGYPVAMNASAFPPFGQNASFAAVNFTDDAQALYAAQAYDAVTGAGAVGFMYFKLQSASGMAPPAGGFTEADLQALAGLAAVYHDQTVSGTLQWLLANLHDIVSRLPGVLGQVGNGWGLLRADGTPRPAYYALQQRYTQP